MLIRRTPGVAGGDACIGQTRIAVWELVKWRRLGLDDERILAGYPDLTAADLAAAWQYYQTRHEEIDTAIAANEGE